MRGVLSAGSLLALDLLGYGGYEPKPPAAFSQLLLYVMIQADAGREGRLSLTPALVTKTRQGLGAKGAGK